MAKTKASGQARTRDAERSRKAILDAAQRLFAERGYLGVTLDEIARRSGTGRSLILYHFKSKLGLWRAAATRAAEAFNRSLDANFARIGDDGSTSGRPATVAAWFDTYMQHPDFARMLVMEGNAKGQRLDFLFEHFSPLHDVNGTSPGSQRDANALMRDVLMAILLAISALGPLMEASMARVAGRESAGLYPMTRERRADIIAFLVRILETFDRK